MHLRLSNQAARPSSLRPIVCRIITLAALVACREAVPAYVYVPSPVYHQYLHIAIMSDAGEPLRAGATLRLHADRHRGPWRRVARDSADLTDCWWRRPPPIDEPEVASGVDWHVDPQDSVRFNIPQPPTGSAR